MAANSLTLRVVAVDPTYLSRVNYICVSVCSSIGVSCRSGFPTPPTPRGPSGPLGGAFGPPMGPSGPWGQGQGALRAPWAVVSLLACLSILARILVCLSIELVCLCIGGCVFTYCKQARVHGFRVTVRGFSTRVRGFSTRVWGLWARRF